MHVVEYLNQSLRYACCNVLYTSVNVHSSPAAGTAAVVRAVAAQWHERRRKPGLSHKHLITLS
jgi:hypothetical protein